MEKNVQILPLSFEEKLQSLFLQLHKVSNSTIDDDTVLQKLQSSLERHIEKKENAVVWCEHIGLVTFICKSLEEDHVQNGKNCETTSFALHCFSSVVAKEENFTALSQHEVMSRFKQAFPFIRENMSLSSNALQVADSLLKHSSGFKWVIENGVWENLLIICLESTSIFVRRACVTVITNLILKVETQQIFSNYIQDLERVLCKSGDVNHKGAVNEHSVASSVANPDSKTRAVLLIFQTLLFKTLGERSLHSQLGRQLDLISQALFRFKFEVASEVVVTLAKMLFLNILHRFQDPILISGRVEPRDVDSVAGDILSLARRMVDRGSDAEFLVASFEVHKYLSIMCRNMEARMLGADLSKCETVSYAVWEFQVIPLQAVCNTSAHIRCETQRKNFEDNYLAWKEKISKNMSIQEQQKIEMRRVLKGMEGKLCADSKASTARCIVHLAHFMSCIEHLHPTSASMLLQMLIFILKFETEPTLAWESNAQLCQHSADCLGSLITRLEGDCQVETLLPLLDAAARRSGNTTRVKVSILQTMKTCVSRLIPCLTLRHRFVEKLEDNCFEELGKSFNVYLSDLDWEVRDSALELIVACMKVSTESSPSFTDWFLRHGFLTQVLQAVGDVEPYVQATAMDVLSTVASIDKIWCELECRSVKQNALRAVVRSGENCVRRSGLALLAALAINSKFTEDEMSKLLIPTVEAATGDPDDEMRLAALKFIHQHLDRKLSSIDLASPKVPSEQGGLTEPQDQQVVQRVRAVICWFCQNGYFSSVLNCSCDSAHNVVVECNCIINIIGNLIDKYDMRATITSCLTVDAPAACRNPSFLNGESKKDRNAQHTSPPSVDTGKEALQYVLGTSDLAVISRLKKEDATATWWTERTSEDLLIDSEIPPQLKPVLASCLFEGIEGAQKAAKNDFGKATQYEETETEMAQLLEDIFLATGTSVEERHESRSRDCY